MLNLTDAPYRHDSQLRLSDLRQLSVSFWAVLDDVGFGFSGFDAGFNFNVGWTVQRLAGDTMQFRAGRNDANHFDVVSDTVTSTTDVVHYAFTWDGNFASGAGRWWFDGVEDTVTTTVGTGAHNFGTGGQVRLGDFNTLNIDVGWFAVWGRVLHEAEIIALSQRQSPLKFRNGLVTYWPLNDPGIIRDVVGSHSLYHETAGETALNDIDVLDPIVSRRFASGFADPPDAPLPTTPSRGDTVFLRPFPRKVA